MQKDAAADELLVRSMDRRGIRGMVYLCAGGGRRRLHRAQRERRKFSDAALGPSDEATVNGVLWRLVGRAVPPSPTRFQNMHDAVQDGDQRHAKTACVLRQQRRDACPLLIAKSKQISHVRATPLEDTQLRFS
jgi:hypothetical protein